MANTSFLSISPTAYVVYYGVTATDNCGTMGNTIASITIAYGPDELSTADAGGLGYPLNYADLSSNCTTATTDIGPGESPACYPWLEYMDKLMTLSPDWSNCGGSPTQPFLDNVYDPPRALVPTNALAGPATSSYSDVPLAAPASTTLPSLALWTSPPSISKPSQASSQNPPPSNAGSGNGPVQNKQWSNNNAGPNSQLPGNDPATDAQSQETPVMALPGQILDPGAALNPSGTPTYLVTSGMVTAIGSSSLQQILTSPTPSQPTGQLTISDATYTVNSASQYLIEGQTLSLGGAITVSNTPISLAANGAVAFVGESS